MSSLECLLCALRALQLGCGLLLCSDSGCLRSSDTAVCFRLHTLEGISMQFFQCFLVGRNIAICLGPSALQSFGMCMLERLPGLRLAQLDRLGSTIGLCRLGLSLSNTAVCLRLDALYLRGMPLFELL